MEAVWFSKMAEHLSPHSAGTRRQSPSAQLPLKPAHIRQVTRIKHKRHSSKSCVSCYFMTLTTEYSVTMHAANPHVWATLHYITLHYINMVPTTSHIPHNNIQMKVHYHMSATFSIFFAKRMLKYQTVWFKTRHLATLDVCGLSGKYLSILNISRTGHVALM
jgi:hypothetical protein